jgi:hypothetical protein
MSDLADALYWGDGTSDKLYLTYSGATGNSNMTVASDPNFTANERTREITLAGTIGGQAVLTITQEAFARDFNNDFNNDYG